MIPGAIFVLIRRRWFVRLGEIVGATVLAAAITPGGLGAIEAALVAGLTGVGLAPGPAVSIVPNYRLATYWLPVTPGWPGTCSSAGSM